MDLSSDCRWSTARTGRLEYIYAFSPVLARGMRERRRNGESKSWGDCLCSVLKSWMTHTQGMTPLSLSLLQTKIPPRMMTNFIFPHKFYHQYLLKFAQYFHKTDRIYITPAYIHIAQQSVRISFTVGCKSIYALWN